LRDILPDSLGAGECKSIAVARERYGTVLSNETRVAHCCRQNQMPCVRLPDILRALWVEGVISWQEVQGLIKELQVKDRMQFKLSTEGHFCGLDIGFYPAKEALGGAVPSRQAR
jgi:hypothetical protein